MPRYFAYFGSYNQPKNALQRAAVELLKGHSGRIVGRHAFFTTLVAEIAALNADHPRCQPLRVSDWLIGSGWGISLGDHFTVSFHLYEIKEDINP